METTPDIFPFAAWEQAVFVVLFIIVVILLTRWFSRQQKEWQEFISHQNDSFQVAIADQNHQWQGVVNNQAEYWQDWLQDQNKRECATMDKVTEALERLTVELAKHDERSANRFLEAIKIAREINGVAGTPARRKSKGE